MSTSQTPEPGTERVLRSTARNPRRRPRQSENNDGSVNIRQPKRRKREKVDDETFKPRESTENIPPASHELDEESITAMNGHLDHTSIPAEPATRMRNGSIRSTPNLDAQMTFRGKPKRAMRGDGATTLTHNQCYSVKTLPSTPKELRKEGVQYRGSLGGANCALAVTHERAYVWDYTAHSAAAHPRTFDLPFPSRTRDPLPFGALVTSGASGSDQGLVLISATSGKTIFYESIERAASLGLFQDRNTGVEGLVGTLFSGETVVDVVSADHAGLVVVLSSGRISQVTLHDTQGKPRIQGQFLRATENTSGSWYGSIGRLWNGGFRKDTSAVHTRPLNVRGQIQAISLTERAEMLLWDLDWSGRSEFKSSIDFREALVNELKTLQLPEISAGVDQTVALDFAFLESATTGKEVTAVGAEQALSFLMLVRVGTADMHSYVIAEFVQSHDRLTCPRIIHITSYQDQGKARFEERPRLVVPRPGHTAFVVFEDATILVDVQEPAMDSPEAQLHESYIQPGPYEEAIYLRSGKDLAIQTMVAENVKGTHASCVAFIKSAGLVRFDAADVKSLPGGAQISAKSRIEQAIFFGSLQPDNILDFSRHKDSKSSLEDVENAAMAVSLEILRAETPYTTFISTSPTSMEQHLATKARALKALVTFVRQNNPALSRGIMWKLLWDAERVAAGQQLWTAFEEHIVMSSENGKRKATLLDELCDWFAEAQAGQQADPFTQREDLKDEDSVRKFFIAGLHKLERLLDFAKGFLAHQHSEQELAPEKKLRLVYQANDVWLRTLRSAFTFRSENSADYGILSELIDDGILVDAAEYVDVPEFWTSTRKFIDNTVAVCELSSSFATEYFDPETMPGASDTARDIALANPKLVELYCLQAQEAIRWRESRPSQKDQEMSKALKAQFDDTRYELCRKLANVGQSEFGMKLAEKYRDMHTLTDMVIGEDQYLEDEYAGAGPENRAIINQQRNELQNKVRRYFDRYNTLWSNAFFDKLFASSSVGVRLEQAQIRWRKPLAEYLRAHPSRAKLCWINDVTTENDFFHASEALVQSAEGQESRLWAKKVELSMSKLAAMAAKEANGGSKRTSLTNGTAQIIRNTPDHELVLVSIQERLYRHLLPEIVASLDRQAEIVNCMQKFGKHVSSYSTLRSLLEHALTLVLDHRALSLEQLIDVLTLMDVHATDSEENLQNSEFYLALTALDAAAESLSEGRFEMLLALIWKRVYVYDNWADLGLSKKKSDAERKESLRSTITWHTLFHFLDNPTATSRIRIVPPEECLGAGCRAEDMAYRFPRDDDVLDQIMTDLRKEDELLAGFLDGKLSDVVAECQRDAKWRVEEKAEEVAGMRRVEREVEEVGEEEMNGHVNGMSKDVEMIA